MKSIIDLHSKEKKKKFLHVWSKSLIWIQTHSDNCADSRYLLPDVIQMPHFNIVKMKCTSLSHIPLTCKAALYFPISPTSGSNASWQSSFSLPLPLPLRDPYYQVIRSTPSPLPHSWSLSPLTRWLQAYPNGLLCCQSCPFQTHSSQPSATFLYNTNPIAPLSCLMSFNDFSPLPPG